LRVWTEQCNIDHHEKSIVHEFSLELQTEPEIVARAVLVRPYGQPNKAKATIMERRSDMEKVKLMLLFACSGTTMCKVNNNKKHIAQFIILTLESLVKIMACKGKKR
jgi:hypothetical protein